MLKYSDLKGAIFDVDCTLLDDQPPGETMGLHEQSRMMAAHEVGKRHGIIKLQQFTPRQLRQAFEEAQVHMVQGVVWQMLVIAGEVSEYAEPDFEHPLVREIVELKEQLHKQILREKGRAVPGAVEFVETLARGGLSAKLAVASTARRDEILLFFEMTGLNRFFPEERIISREQLTHAKPHPQAFDLAFKTLRLPTSARSHIAAFEDDPRGIMSAKAAGLYVCAITTRHDKKSLAKLTVPPDLIADSFDEFHNLLGLPGKLKI